MILLSREEFQRQVFDRDNGKCVVCGQKADAAHHIIDRSLFEDGGYYTDNGVSLCSDHHLQAEQTTISCKDLRKLAGIVNVILPEHLDTDEEWDHWANIVMPTGARLRGELFFQDNVQKALKDGGVLGDFLPYTKYPRTYHLPSSPNLQNDDRQHKNVGALFQRDLVATIKMDGENCFDGDTLIATNEGDISIKRICEEKLNLKVLSVDIDSNKVEYQSIEEFIITDEREDWFEIELENGSKLSVTEDQYIWLPKYNCYRRVKDLKEGDDILLK